MKIQIKYKSLGELPLKYYNVIKIDNGNELENNVKILAVLCDVSEEDIYNLTLSEIDELTNTLYKLKEPNHNINLSKIIIDGKEYKVEQDVNKISYAQFVDFQTYVKDKEKYMAEIISTFLLPKGEKYNITYNPLDVANVFREHLTIEQSESLINFFFHKLSRSLKCSLMFSMWKMTKTSMMTKNKELKQAMRQATRKTIQFLRGSNS